MGSYLMQLSAAAAVVLQLLIVGSGGVRDLSEESLRAADSQIVLTVPSPGGVGSFIVPAVAFKPEDPTTEHAFRPALETLNDFDDVFYLAPVNLPSGMQIKKLSMATFDTSTIRNIRLELV